MIYDVKFENLKPRLSQNFELDYRERVTNGIVNYYLMYRGGGNLIEDLVSRVNGTISDPSFVSWGTFQGGVGLVSAATAATTTGISLSPARATGSVFSFIARISLSSGSDAFGRVYSANSSAGVYTASSGFIDLFSSASGGDQFNNTQMSRGPIHTIGIAQASTAAGAATFYLDGRADGTARGVNFTPTGMVNDSGSQTFVGTLYQVALWNRVLTAEEMFQLHQEPYVMLRPQPLIRYWTYGNVTSTGAAGTGFVIPTRTLLGVGR